MFYVVFAVFAVLVLYRLYRGERRLLFNDTNVPLKEEELSNVFTSLSRGCSLPKMGGRGAILQNEGSLKSANKYIIKKVRGKKKLYECEKWIYDNYYLLAKTAKNLSAKSFSHLPHCGDVPRIVLFAEYLANYTAGKIDEQALGLAIESFSCGLYYAEYCALEDALKLVLLKKCINIAERILHFKRISSISLRLIGWFERLSKSKFLGKIAAKKTAKLQKICSERITPQTKTGVAKAYASTVFEANVLSERVITSLHVICSGEVNLFESCEIYKLLLEDNTFELSEDNSRHCYLRRIAELSDKINLNEGAFTERLFKLSRLTGTDISVLLFTYPKQLLKYCESGIILPFSEKANKKPLAFGAAVTSLSLAAGAISGVLLTVYSVATIAVSVCTGVLCVFASVPLFWKLLISISNKLTEPSTTLSFDCHKIELKPTVCLYSMFIGDIEHFKCRYRQIQSIASVNKNDNVRFVALVDTPPCEGKTDDIEVAVLNYVASIREQDNCELLDNVDILIRKKILRNGVEVARERKRGAIEDYVFALDNNDFSAFEYCSSPQARPEFLVLLDEDSVLEPEGVARAIACMMHPLNDYDLMSFGSKYNLASLRTVYSQKYLCNSGYSIYGENSDFFLRLGGNALFCGKGVVRLDSYVQKLLGAFPENRILSHDLLEGGRLKVGSLPISLFEEAPVNFATDKKRSERWLRGDIQLLPFLNRKYQISACVKTIILKNAFEPIFTLAAFSLALLAVFTLNRFVAVIFAFTFGLPFVFELLALVSTAIDGKRLRYSVVGVFSVLIRALFSIALLPYCAIKGFSVFLCTCLRLLRNKRLLEWNTFFMSKNDSCLPSLAPTLFALTLLLILARILGNTQCVIIASVLCAHLVAIATAFVLGEIQTERKTKALSDEDRINLLDTAKKTYSYFVDMKVDGLIADNYQEEYSIGRSNQTSPTNIGYSLIADICACELGFIDNTTAIDSISATISSVEKLEKWHGNLYNWYDIECKTVLTPRFVSSVDCGNFVACLLVCKAFCKENLDLSARIERLLNDTNLNMLFDSKKKQFYVGYTDGEGYLGHYDLLESEARLLGFVAVSMGMPCGLWNSLSRQHTDVAGNTLYSWNGTAFEYLMADIFLDSPKLSMLYASSKNCVRVQKRRKCNGLFGISESAYYAFDNNLLYQYKAFGLSELALRSEVDRCVISPYSGFLMLQYSKKSALKNLKKLESVGACGKYGYYEAVDYTGGQHVVSEFMAHHQGMILSAIASMLNKDVLKRLFVQDLRLAGTAVLLSELPPQGKGEKKPAQKYLYDVASPEQQPLVCDVKYLFPKGCAMFGRGYSVYIDDFGNGVSVAQENDINRYTPDLCGNSGMFFVVKQGEEVYSPTYAPLKNEKLNFSATLGAYYAEYKNTDKDVVQEVFCPENVRGEIRRLKFGSDITAQNKKVLFYADLCLEKREVYARHPNFCDMFVTAERLDDRSILFSRKNRFDDSVEYYCVTANLPYVAVCEREKLYGFNSPSNSFPAFEENTDTIGDLLSPCIGLVFEPSGDDTTVEVCIFCAKNKVDAIKTLARIKIQNPLLTKSVQKLPLCSEDLPEGTTLSYLNSIIPKLLHIPFANDILSALNAEQFQDLKYYSSDFKKKLLYIDYVPGSSLLREVSKLLKALYLLRIPAALIVRYEDSDDYYRSVFAEMAREKQFGTIGRDIFFVKEDLSALAFCKITAEYADLIFNEYAVNCIKPTVCAFDEQAVNTEFIGFGGFDKNNDYLVASSASCLPYSNVIGAEYGGTLITNRGDGCTWYKNSVLGRLTSHSFDFVKAHRSERIWLLYDGKLYLLNGGENSTCKHGRGYTEFMFSCGKASGKLSVYTVKNGAAKVYEVVSGNLIDCKIIVDIDLATNDSTADYLTFSKLSENTLRVDDLGGTTRFASISCGRFILNANEFKNRVIGGLSCFGGSFYFPSLAAVADFSGVFRFALGGTAEAVRLDMQTAEPEKVRGIEHFHNINPFRLETGIFGLDTYFNDWSLYQVLSSRIFGRAGFYQIGGAFGFRDLLQDSLALLYCRPDEVRKIVLLAAEHQYIAGDVQHWWHPERLGIRSKISDDRLFLPYVTGRYIQTTGDKSILLESLPYLDSEPLGQEENSRYEQPQTTSPETLEEHILRALDCIKTGENGLLLIEGGDWNDALDQVGNDTSGESVWLTMFYCLTIRTIMPYLSGEVRIELAHRLKALERAIDGCWDEDRYKRLVTKDGEWLGGHKDRFELDILTQAFSVLSGACPTQKYLVALDTAMSTIDRNNQLVPLFDKSIEGGARLGYISSYHKGIRENGQYTHAAVWLAYALVAADRIDDAFDLMLILNPIERCRDEVLNGKYLGEPYVIAADIYTAEAKKGRCGWSWYTGSAGWYYQSLLELFGVGIRDNRLTLSPRLPKRLKSVKIQYRYFDSLYDITVERGNEPALYLDGLKILGVQSFALKRNVVRKIRCVI